MPEMDTMQVNQLNGGQLPRDIGPVSIHEVVSSRTVGAASSGRRVYELGSIRSALELRNSVTSRGLVSPSDTDSETTTIRGDYPDELYTFRPKSIS
jgi:hypothetical protein